MSKNLKPPPPPIHFDRFVAIDFETADCSRDSACAISLVVVERGKITRQFTSLIRPPRPFFQFTWLHGISWQDVADKPDFGELWPRLVPYLDGAEFIAAHNAGFDRSVLDECCTGHGIVPPALRYCCSMRLARKLWDIRPTKLSDVCGQFGITLNHHDAASDALACAKIVLRAWGDGIPAAVFLKPQKKSLQLRSGAGNA